MDGLNREVLARLPLAEAVLWLWRWCADESFLRDLYQHWRGRSYEKILTFPTLVYLVADALLKHEGSARQSFERASEVEMLPTSVVAAYGKLRRLPIELSQAFLSECTQRLAAAVPVSTESRLPPSLDGFEVVIFDGKTIKHLAKRLKPLRGMAGGAVGGKAVVAMSLNSGLVLALRAHPDGHANEVRLVPDLVPEVRRLVAGKRLWLGDRAYSYPELLNTLAGEEDHFVIRLRGDITFTPDKDSRVRRGRDSQGRRVVEQWGQLGRLTGRHHIYVRRITLDRGKEQPIVLVTNLIDANRYPAGDLLDLYRSRWGIERVFQQVTEVFNLKHLIGSTPEASVFQFSFCLLLYNTLQVVRATLALIEQRAAETISTEKLFVDVREHLIAWGLLIGPLATVELWPNPVGLDQVSRRLAALLKSVWTPRWIKAPPKKKPQSSPRRSSRKSLSAHQAIQKRKRGGNPQHGQTQ